MQMRYKSRHFSLFHEESLQIVLFAKKEGLGLQTWSAFTSSFTSPPPSSLLATAQQQHFAVKPETYQLYSEIHLQSAGTTQRNPPRAYHFPKPPFQHSSLPFG